ncbi:FtsX-like permease family protein [Candidatus Fermentibacteria bacterium]|nr:FtsX-like permease family protein [Candidatus Fermentibacteria bacterium]
MLLALRLAVRNLIGAGLRTWLNALVLSFSFVVIIWLKGIMVGWDHQAKNDMTDYEIGGGQYWHHLYDPYDPLSLSDSHAPVPSHVKDEIQAGDMEPVLVVPGHIFPRGRMQSVVIKGINPAQTIWKLPTGELDADTDAIPAMIGAVMANGTRLGQGDRVMIRWRDTNGTFDAAQILITAVFSSNVPSAEAGQVYVPLERLRKMAVMHDQATILTFRDGRSQRPEIEGWILKTKAELTRQVDDMIKAKTVGQSIFYGVLLLLAMLAIFDTQVLSIFRRQKEIGTYIALGYTRKEVVGLFTVEGAMHAVLAAFVATLYGLPFLAWQAKAGWTIPMEASEFGMAMAQTLYPVYTVGLVVSTALLVTLATAVVSYVPSRRIARMNPTDALRGKLQ